MMLWRVNNILPSLNNSISDLSTFLCVIPALFYLHFSINLEHNNLTSFSGLINLPNLRVRFVVVCRADIYFLTRRLKSDLKFVFTKNI